MSKIDGYTYQERGVQNYEGWDAATKTLTPVEYKGAVYGILDNLTLAVEAGVIDNYLWPKQVFKTRKNFDAFFEEFSEYDQCYRISDRWWMALSKIADVVDEEAFVSSSEISEKLVGEAEKYGLLENFGRKKPKYLYSEEECRKAELQTHIHYGSGMTYIQSLSRAELQDHHDKTDFSQYYALKLTTAEIDGAMKEGAEWAKAQKKAKKPAEKKSKSK